MKTNDAAAVGRIVVIPVSCVDDVVVVTASPDDAKKRGTHDAIRVRGIFCGPF